MTAEAPEPFRPDWTVAPAEPLREWLDEYGLTADSLAAAGEPGRQQENAALIQAVLDRKPLTAAHARVLEATGFPARFWLAMEAAYREGLAAGRTESPPVIAAASGPEHVVTFRRGGFTITHPAPDTPGCALEEHVQSLMDFSPGRPGTYEVRYQNGWQWERRRG